MILLVVATCIFMRPTLGFFSSMLDEGWILTVSDRLAQGDVLYKQVSCHLPPLIPWVFEAAFRCFGVSVATSQAVYLAIWLAIVLLIYGVGRGFMGPRHAFLAALGCMLTGADEAMHSNYHWMANLPIFALLIVLHRTVAVNSRLGWLMSGVVAGLAGLTLHTFEPVALVICLAGVFEVCRRLKTQPWQPLFLGVCGVSAPLLLFFAWLASTHNFAACYQNLIVDNLQRAPVQKVLLQNIPLVWGDVFDSDMGSMYLRWMLPLSLLLPVTLGLPLLRHSSAFRLTYLAHVLMLLAILYRFMPSQALWHGLLGVPLIAGACSASLAPRLARAIGVCFLGLALCDGVVNYRYVAGATFPVKFPRGTVRALTADDASQYENAIKFMQEKNPDGAPSLIAPDCSYMFFLMGFKNDTPYVLLGSQDLQPEQQIEAARHLRRSVVFRFNTYDRTEFLLKSWSSIDLERYAREAAAFNAELARTHDVMTSGPILFGTKITVFTPSHSAYTLLFAPLWEEAEGSSPSYKY